jgi:hypothetical protein
VYLYIAEDVAHFMGWFKTCKKRFDFGAWLSTITLDKGFAFSGEEN